MGMELKTLICRSLPGDHRKIVSPLVSESILIQEHEFLQFSLAGTNLVLFLQLRLH